jgi:integrase/recombinase XerD
MDIRSAVDGYLLLRYDLADTTVVHYKVVFNAFMEFMEGGTAIESVTAADVRRFLGHVKAERNLSDRSVHDYWVPLSSLWTWAEKELGIPHVIRGRVRKPDFNKPVIYPLGIEDVKRMLVAAEFTSDWDTRTGQRTRSKRPEAARDKAMILTLIDTGLRASEICAVQVQHYDPDTGKIQVIKGKGNKDRTVFLGKRARQAIWKYWSEREDLGPRDWMFTAKTDRKLDRNNLRHTLQRIAQRAGVRHVTVHMFRHTFAINYLRNGGNVFTLQELLGHSDLDTVQTYLRIAESDLSTAHKIASPVDNWRL